MDLLPLFVNLTGRVVLLVGGGPVAAAKLGQLLAAGAHVRVVAPDVSPAIHARQATAEHAEPAEQKHQDLFSARSARSAVALEIHERPFVPSDLDDVWLVVAAATPAVNRDVARAAETRRVFVNAVDDPPNATAFLSGVVRRDGVTIAISTSGDAPGLTALIRAGLDALLPHDLATWVDMAREERAVWRRDGVPMAERRPLLLKALNNLYQSEGSWL